jgi:1-acyl-sn-glycerol-3-phosphate acyltransferase
MARASLGVAILRAGMDGERDLWFHLSRLGVGAVFGAAFRIRFGGLLNIPSSGGALICTNHVSVLDPVFVGLAGARRGRPVRFLALSELFDSGIVGWAIRKTRQIPLRRGTGDWDAIHAVAAVVRSGALAGMSPEGRVTDGVEELAGQKGAARIALAADRPVIPSGIWGSNYRWPQEGLRHAGPLRPPVVLVFGRPIHAAGDPRDPRDVRALTERIMADVRRLRGIARARAEGLLPGPPPADVASPAPPPVSGPPAGEKLDGDPAHP